MSRDENLLFGIWAWQLGIADRRQIVAAIREYGLDGSRSVAEILRARQALTVEQSATVVRAVQDFVAAHGNDPAQGLAAARAEAGPLADELGLAAFDATLQPESRAPADGPFQSLVAAVAVDPQATMDQGPGNAYPTDAQPAEPDLTIDAPPPTDEPSTCDPAADPWQTMQPSDERAATLAANSVDGVGASTSSGTRFRVLYRLARGGLGEVFVASDQELNRRVALKQIQDDQADRPDCRARFLLEAEVTGGLEHPGIVPVYGLGQYPNGRPYYAMRFIRGDSLEEAIRRFHAAEQSANRGLEFRQLLGRFIAMCNAIEYAHSRLVIHRDLKPGNVMLGKFGETLVVDWGLAKTLGKSSTAAGADDEGPLLTEVAASNMNQTREGAVIGTPTMMSPEQAWGMHEQMGPAADIFSLGATLYQLLTGRPPYQARSLNDVLDLARRADFPPPRQLAADIPRPIEAICLKAMAARPDDRYISAKALADDLEHWLADEPVEAYAERWQERASRWARRHRALVRWGITASLLITLVSVVAGLLVNQARKESETNRGRAERSFAQARQAVDTFFTQVSESKLLGVPGLQPLRSELLQSALEYYEDFARQRADDPAMRRELAASYYRSGLINDQIGHTSAALAALEKAAAIQRRMMEDHEADGATAPADDRLRVDLANTLNALGDLNLQIGQPAKALDLFSAAQSLRQRLVDAHPEDRALRRKLANSFSNQAEALSQLGRLAEAAKRYTDATEIRLALVHDFPDDNQHASDLAQGYYNQGLFQRDQSHLDIAADLLAQAATTYERLVAKVPKSIDYRRELAITYRVSGDLAAQRGQRDEASNFYQQALNLAEKLARQNAFLTELKADVAAIYLSLGQLEQQTAELTKAVGYFERARDIEQQLVSDDPAVTRYSRDLAGTRLQLGIVLLALGDLDAARENFDTGRRSYDELLALEPDSRDLQIARAQSLLNLALIDRAAGHAESALAAFRQVQQAYEELRRRAPGPDADFGLADALVNVAVEQRTLGRPEEALAALAEARRTEAPTVAAHPDIPKYLHSLAEVDYMTALVHAERGELEAALTSYQLARDARVRLVKEHSDNLDFQNLLGVVLDEMAVVEWQLGRQAQALATARQATEFLRQAHAAAPQVVQYRRALGSHYVHRAVFEQAIGELPRAAEMLLADEPLVADDAGASLGLAAQLAEVADANTAEAIDPAERQAWRKKAVDILRQALTRGLLTAERLKSDPQLESLRATPEFQSLLDAGKK